jgi:4-amino-4-deoxy-L-arabinose transferase-like glycosyltransferase
MLHWENRKMLAVGLLLVGLLITMTRLGRSPINQWDESRLAINALEMWHHGWSVVTTYGGQPDHWNTKPPLLIWLQTASFHLFGPSEWSFRLPSALAATAMGMLLFWFVLKATGHVRWAVLTALVLWTTPGFMRMHVARSGDYDALLSLWVVAGTLLFYLAVMNRNWRLLPGVFLLFGLAVWTKGIAGALLGPALLLFVIVQKQLMPMLQSRWLWLGLGLWLAMVAGIYGWRMAVDPGYLEAIVREELGGRYGRVIMGSGHGPWYYLTLFFDYRQYSYWMFFFLPGLVIMGRTVHTALAWLVGSTTVLMLLVLSASATKFDWYQAPVYPLMALATAAAIHALLQVQWLRKSWLSMVAAALVLAYPLSVVVNENIIHDRVSENYPLSGWLKARWDQSSTSYHDFYLLQAQPLNIDDSRHLFYTLRASMLGLSSGTLPAEIAPQQGTFVMEDSYYRSIAPSLRANFTPVEQPVTGYTLFKRTAP